MRRQRIVGVLVVVGLMCASAVGAQPPVPPPTIAVLVTLTIKPDADRAQLTKTMPDEVRATLKLYLDGRIQQWYARADGRGVLFILNATDTAVAKALMDDMPLSKGNLANYEYIPIGPLTPLRALLAPAGTK
jgi:hypothetical protein